MLFKPSVLLHLLIVIYLLGRCSVEIKKPTENLPEILTVIEEPDLIPEGTAYYPSDSLVLVGSTYKRKIVAIRQDGSYYDFIPAAEDDLLSPLGMEVDPDRNHLWVVTAKAKYVLPTLIPTDDPQWRSTVRQYSLPDKKLLAEYPLIPENDSTNIMLNDLTIAEDGKVYASESIGNGIYVIDPQLQQMKLFLKPAGASFLNGLDFDDSGTTLFVGSTEGILAIDVRTRSYTFLEADSTMNLHAVDGLAFRDDYIIGHQSKIVTKFLLDEKHKKVVGTERLDGDDLDSSTTGEIAGDYYYYIVNSQIRSGIDYDNQRIKPLDSLEAVVIKKIRIR